MGWQRKTAKSNGYHKGKSDLRERFRPNPGGFWSKLEPDRKCECLSGFWKSPDQIARVIKKVACNDRVVKISVHRRGFDVFFGKKAQNNSPAAGSRAESTERLDLLKQAFENEGLESKVLKTWTHPKSNACPRKWKRFNWRLCGNMEKEFENLQKVHLRKK